MAIVRTAVPLGAALIALASIGPATSQAQAPGAPLQLVPGPSQAKPATRAATNSKAVHNKSAAKPAAKAPGKATTNTASRPSQRQNAASPQPATKAARTNSQPRANPVASNRQNKVATSMQRARNGTSPRIIHMAVVPYLTATRPVLRRGAQEPPIIARGPNTEVSEDRVMRGRDSVSLVGMLPWWRSNRMQDVNYGSAEADSKVLEAATVWLATNGGASEAETVAGEPGVVAGDEAIEVADAGEVNEIDQAAASDPEVPTPTFLQSLWALIGGAAIAAIASVRLLFA